MRLFERDNGDNWWFQFNHHGRQIRRSAGTSDREAAQEHADRFKANLWRQDKLGDAPAVRWEEAALAWLEEHKHLRSLSDRKDHLRWFSTHLKGLTLAAIDRRKIEELQRSRSSQRSGPKHDSRELSPATFNRYFATLSAVLNFAKDREWIAAVPSIPKKEELTKRVRFLSPVEARRLITKLPEHLAPLVEFSLATGLRQANVTHLTWDQVDLSRKIAWIHAEQAKGKSTIGIPLAKAAIDILRRQRGIHERWVLPYRDEPIDNPANTAWIAALKKAKIDEFRWHDLRHTWASWHVQNGTPLPVLMELGGWRDLKMVLRYAHLAPTHLAQYAGNTGVALKRIRRV
jgi:integrase